MSAVSSIVNHQIATSFPCFLAPKDFCRASRILFINAIAILVDCAVDASRDLALYTVGPATYRSLNTLRKTYLPHATLLGENAGTGELLAPLILEHYNSLERNQATRSNPSDGAQTKLPLLFLVGEVHRDIIPKTLMSPDLPVQERIHIDELIVYETTVMESFRQDFSAVLKSLNWDGSIENENQETRSPIWIVVFSPTGCDAMVDILGINARNGSDNHCERSQITELLDRKRKCFIATIGPTTRDHLRSNFGVEPDVCAEQPSPEGVAKGIEMVMNQ